MDSEKGIALTTPSSVTRAVKKTVALFFGYIYHLKTLLKVVYMVIFFGLFCQLTTTQMSQMRA